MGARRSSHTLILALNHPLNTHNHTPKQLEKEADASFKSTDARQLLQLLQAARQRKAAADRAEKARWSKVGG